MWRSKWSLVKVLFFIVRYPPFADTSLVLYRAYFALFLVPQNSVNSYRSAWVRFIACRLFSVVSCDGLWALIWFVPEKAHWCAMSRDVPGGCRYLWKWVDSFGGWTLLTSIVGIIMMRTWAIWGRRKVVAFGLLFLFVITFVPSCVLLARFIRSLTCEHIHHSHLPIGSRFRSQMPLYPSLAT